MESYKEFVYQFDNEKIYTRRQLAELLEQQAKRHIVNRVILKGKDVDIALQILSIHETPEGRVVIVK